MHIALNLNEFKNTKKVMLDCLMLAKCHAKISYVIINDMREHLIDHLRKITDLQYSRLSNENLINELIIG